MMTVETEPLALLARALDQATEVVAGIRPHQTGLATPCLSWDVTALVRHLAHDVEQFTVVASGGKPDWAAPAPDLGDDWAAAFRERADALLDTWSNAGSLDGTISLPGLGEVPARFPVDQQIADAVVHTWDIARATRRPTEGLDPEVAEASLVWMRSTLRPEFRGDEASGKAFGPEVPAPADAPVYDRLAAFAGRRPG